MTTSKATTWTVDLEGGNGEIVLKQGEDPATLTITQGTDIIYLESLSGADELHSALGDLIAHAKSEAGRSK